MTEKININDHITHKLYFYYPSNKMMIESYTEFAYVFIYNYNG